MNHNYSDMSALTPHDVVSNCRLAFDSAENLGIPRVIDPSDMNLLAVPDKLAVMTYLHQLRAHFTGHQLEIEQFGKTSDESSYVIGNYKSDNLGHDIVNLDHIKNLHLNHQNSLEDDENKSPTQRRDVKNLILSGSKNLLGKVLSPAKDKNVIAGQANQNGTGNQQQPAQDKPILMTRRELTDPFGSDDEDENDQDCGKDTDKAKVNGQDQSGAPQLDPVTTTVSFLLLQIKIT